MSAELTSEQIAAIKAAVRRIWPNITDEDAAIEVAWAIQELRPSERGDIIWRSAGVGNLLLAALAEAQNWRCCYCVSEPLGME